MKRILLLLVTIATLSLSSFAQAPEGFSYQAVIRNSANLTLDNQAVGMQLKIRESSITGTVVYTETFATSTNSYGLVSLEIGSGTSADDFSAIAWATNGPFFIETAVDETGGTTYVVMGTSKLMSVAYALYAKTAGNAETVTNGIYTTSSVADLSDVTGVGSGAIITAAERTKLNGIEANADVTDAMSVVAAGAVMDSEVTDLVGIKGVTISTLQVKPSEGAFADGDKTKLDGIEANADVTDATNVAAAGAVMTTGDQTIAGVKTFNENAQIGTGTASEKMTIGYMGHSTWSGFRNASLSGATDFALLQSNTGNTLMNASLGQNLSFRIGNTAKMDITAIGVALNDNQLRLRGAADGNHYLAYQNGGGFDGAKLHGNLTIALQTNNMEVVMRDGRVGINTSAPSKGVLHVAGGKLDYSGGGNYFSNWTNTTVQSYGGGPQDISIYAERYIVTAYGFLAESDARIKDIQRISDASADLEALAQIQITDYTMKDHLRSGKTAFKKVIAQQVESVYPLAVGNTSNFIPDVYDFAQMENGKLSLETSLEVDDKVKLFINDSEEIIAKVVSKTDNTVSFDLTHSGKVFVYGKEVDDFKIVDYEAISMLNVSATQELYKLILKQQKTIENQKTEISAQKEISEGMQSEFDARIKTLEEMFNMSTLNK